MGDDTPVPNEMKGNPAMRHATRTVFLALIAAFAISAAAAASASASPEWYVKKAGVFAKLTTSVNVKLENKIELLDFDSIGFSCEAATATGEIKTGGAGVIKTFEARGLEAEGCKGIKNQGGGGKELESFQAANLPWTTELYKEGTEIRQRDAGTGGKAPGVTFRVGGSTDECVGATSTHMTNNLTAGLVEAAFDAKSGKNKCSWSNGNNGEWKGVMKIKPTSEEKAKGVEAIKVE